MKFSLGFSPCPNDTFIFDAMIHHKIDTEGLEFEVKMADVAELNKLAFEDKLDITKISYHAFAYIQDNYLLLNSGSALGNNCGPLLIAKKMLDKASIENGTIAIPGKYTTANFLLGLAYPEAKNKQEFLFSEIEDAVLQEKVTAGLIIHENRFTFEAKGLVKIVDLGSFWEDTTQMPIPLGGIAIKKNIPPALRMKIDRVLARSVRFALNSPEKSRDFVQKHAQEMDIEVMYKHINLYVNDFTADLGETGKAAVELLYDMALEKKIITYKNNQLFVQGNRE